MAEVQRLIDLPNDVMLNISSFLLRPKQEMRLHYNKKFKEIQHKNKTEIEQIETKVRIIKGFDILFIEENHPIRETKYGYKVINKAYSFKTAFNIFKRQSEQLSKMIKPYGKTNIEVEFSLYNRNNALMKSIVDIDCLPLSTDAEEIEDELGRQIYHIEHYVHITNSKNCKFDGMKFTFTNRVLHIDD